jgi:riboflavin synthase
MFTGIVEQVGLIQTITTEGENKHFQVAYYKPLSLIIGDSIAVNGVCLTITIITEKCFTVTAVAETLRLTNLAVLKQGTAVNLETPLTANRSMGGHYVQGHVDGTAKIIGINKEGDSWTTTFEIPESLTKYIVKKGFITIDGMSITVVTVTEQQCSVVFIPHTIHQSIVQFYQPGQLVNIETDIMAKYVERYINATQEN